MFSKKIFIATFIYMFVSGLVAGCGQVTPAATHEKNRTTSSHTGKPSAPIQLTHNYDGVSYLGERENLTLSVTSGIAGTLAISVSSKEGIIVEGIQAFSQDVAANEKLNIPLAISLSEEGKYYLTIHTAITTDNGNQSKTFALAISTPEPKNSTNTFQDLEKTAPKMKIMDAEEEVKQE
ncbi:MAG: hypothetical protein ACRBCS_00110 [Cellvibrionaceae bacterium]